MRIDRFDSQICLPSVSFLMKHGLSIISFFALAKIAATNKNDNSKWNTESISVFSLGITLSTAVLVTLVTISIFQRKSPRY